MDRVQFFSEDIEFVLSDDHLIAAWIIKVCIHHATELNHINVIFCSDEYLLKMNKEYLNHDYYTDIITFPYSATEIEGDLFISVDRVRENAADEKTGIEQELRRVIIHGVLHLIGFGDKSEKEIEVMRSKEDEAMKMFDS